MIKPKPGDVIRIPPGRVETLGATGFVAGYPKSKRDLPDPTTALLDVLLSSGKRVILLVCIDPSCPEYQCHQFFHYTVLKEGSEE